MRNVLRSVVLIAATFEGWSATPLSIVPSGSDVLVRVNETIDSKTADEGRVCTGQLDQDLLDTNGRVAFRRVRGLN